MARRREREEYGSAGGHEAAGMMRWLLTYADLITLLMAFFIVMYAMSEVNTQRYALLSKALRLAFNGRPSIIQTSSQIPLNNGRTPTNQRPMVPAQQSLASLYRQVQGMIKKHHLQGMVHVQVTNEGVAITFQAQILFASGSDRIRASAYPTLKDTAGLLGALSNSVDVRGFTDDVPIDTPRFPSNWELSVLRATQVVHFMIRQGLAPARLSATGFGRYHPVATNATAAGRQENRRVELVVLANPLGG